MSSLDFHTSPTSALPEKFRALGSKVRDPLARSGPSFDGAGDVEQEFYCGDDSDSDEGAGSPEADHPFSGPRSFRKSGFSLTAISEEDEDEDEDEEEGEEGTTATDHCG
ncbi:hypothetical protein GSI_15065 [Ganoderma sinense ZZ0214-1]|uniref:Uncharacterized protein n=1 Tax=Ganoderma sinense ZZ0214-1 TaxID=1077348 RepID=A0A2G8RLH8_9APHY|nr:hypothetical protein GSI_15065 [Ganoderma sinense ZZ0214-1]